MLFCRWPRLTSLSLALSLSLSRSLSLSLSRALSLSLSRSRSRSRSLFSSGAARRPSTCGGPRLGAPSRTGSRSRCALTRSCCTTSASQASTRATSWCAAGLSPSSLLTLRASPAAILVHPPRVHDRPRAPAHLQRRVCVSLYAVHVALANQPWPPRSLFRPGGTRVQARAAAPRSASSPPALPARLSFTTP